MFRLLLFVLLWSHLEADSEYVSRQKVLMGTFVTLSVDASHKELLSPAFTLLKKIEASLSSYDKKAIIYRLNHERKVHLDGYAKEALQLSLAYYKETDGYFDIAVGSITKKLYHFGGDQRLPSVEDLKKASTDIKGVFIDGYQAYLLKGVNVDLGGMGKGYGVDKVSDFFKKHHVREAVIALSGDIRCLGSCKIAVQDPFHTEKNLATFMIKNSGVSTSGNYRRYVKSQKHNHLIDPKTKSSEKNFISVTLLGSLPSATLDAYATAVSVMPLKKAYAFLDKQDLGYIILQSDQKLVVSHNINAYLSALKLKGLRF